MKIRTIVNLESLKSGGNRKQLGAWAAALLPAALAVFLVAGLGLCAGCGKNSGGGGGNSASTGDPQVDATLRRLTFQLQRTRLASRTPMTRNFDDFANLRTDLTIPPPPAGTKYAIDDKWRVVLVKQ